MSGECSRTISTGGCLVLVPGLLSVAHSGHVSGDEAAGLCRLLDFAQEIELPESETASVESIVASILLPDQETTCAAQVTWHKDFKAPKAQLKSDSVVLRADPAYQQIDMNNATLGNPQELELTIDDCNALLQTLNNHFTADGMRFEYKHPQRWYCHFENNLSINTTPVSAAIGRDVARCRPVGTDARQWRSKLAEIEMLLFEHPVNTAREQDNKLPVNTLWLWGEGEVVSVKATPDKDTPDKDTQIVSVFSDNFYTQSVAEFSGVGCSELPLTSAAIQQDIFSTLIVIDRFTHATSSSQGTHSQTLKWFDEVICDQLWRRLRASGWPEVTLWFGDNRLFRIPASVKKQYLRRLFNKPKPLTAYLPDSNPSYTGNAGHTAYRDIPDETQHRFARKLQMSESDLNGMS